MRTFQQLLLGAVLGGILVIPALAQTNAPANLEPALQDLSAAIGQPVATKDEAKAVCDQERYLVACADIGKKYNLYEPQELTHVEAFIAEVKGKVAEQLSACRDADCLLGVAKELAEKVSAKSPTIAQNLDFTPERLKVKATIIQAAKEVGVDFEQCRLMDPATAPVELLRACAKLAKDQRLQDYLPATAEKQAAYLDPALTLREALANNEYQCGDNTLEGCGNFCLNPPPEARGQGTGPIPAICRVIAEKFFGPEGVRQLEQTYEQVGYAADFYLKKAGNLIFTTHDGRTLTSPPAIGRYLEEQGRRGNVAAVAKGLDFMIAHGFAKPEEKEFVLKMVQRAQELGGQIELDKCRENPEACREFVPEEFKGQFETMNKIDRLMKAAMQKEGVPGPEFCENPEYGERCLKASKTALPELEALAGDVPQAQFIIADIKRHIEFGERGMEARARAQREFETQQQPLVIENGQEFNDFRAFEEFCKTNPAACLAESAKRGFVDAGHAAERYAQSVDVFTQGPPAFEQFSGDFGPPGQGQQFAPPFGGTPPGQQGFLPPTGSQLPANFSKEEALQRFKTWLDNPQGPPPMMNFGPPTPSVGQPPNVFQVPPQPTPPNYFPPNFQPPQPTACPIIQPLPCPAGQYRKEIRNEKGCVVFGECVSEPVNKFVPVPCPAMPTVESCPTGQEKYVSYSSPECGAYYACRPAAKPAACEPVAPCSAGQYHPEDPTTHCPRTECVSESPSTGSGNWSKHYWIFADGTEQSYILNRTDSEYLNFIKSIEDQCRAISRSRLAWRSGAGNDAAANWQNFGIPDCSGAAVNLNPQPTDQAAYCAETGGIWDGYNCRPAGTNTATTCGANQYWNGWTCASSPTNQTCASGQYWNGTACVNSTAYDPVGDCARAGGFWSGDSCQMPVPSNQASSVCYDCASCLAAGCPKADSPDSSCRAFVASACATSTTSGTTCPTGQYWNGSACQYSTSQACASGQYWNGTTCVNSPQTCSSGQYWNGTTCATNPPSCPSNQYWDGNACVNNPVSSTAGQTCQTGQYWNGSACVNNPSYSSDPSVSCAQAGGTWNAGMNYCQMPGTTSSGGGSGATYSSDPAMACSQAGGSWNASTSYCQMPSTTSSGGGGGTGSYSSDPATACSQAGGTWDGTACQMPNTSSRESLNLFSFVAKFMQGFVDFLTGQ